MKIIVLGANGFIGSSLVKNLQVLLEQNNKIQLLAIADLNDFYMLPLQNYEKSIIIDCIGVKSLFYNQDFSQSDENNFMKMELLNRYTKLLERCRVTHSKFIFICSGGSIYGSYLNNPWRETDVISPVDNYGIANKLIEELVINYDGISIRGANIYGSLKRNKQKQGLITELLFARIFNKKIQIFNQGFDIRDYLYIDDFIKALINIVIKSKEIPQIINLSSGVGLSQISILKLLDNLLIPNGQSSIYKNVIFLNYGPSKININILNPSLYIKHFGPIMKVDMTTGLNFMLRELKILR